MIKLDLENIKLQNKKYYLVIQNGYQVFIIYRVISHKYIAVSGNNKIYDGWKKSSWSIYGLTEWLEQQNRVTSVYEFDEIVEAKSIVDKHMMLESLIR